MERRPIIAVYMMANRPYGTLYIGVTSDLETHVNQHQSGELGGFTEHRLVWFEPHESIVVAIRREKSRRNTSGTGRSV